MKAPNRIIKPPIMKLPIFEKRKEIGLYKSAPNIPPPVKRAT